MKIYHDIENSRIWYERDSAVAYLIYVQSGDQADVVSTYVPKELEGQGVAAAMMQVFYEYATDNGLTPIGTCAYAEVWLQRHA